MQMDRRRYNGIEVEVLDYSSVRPGEKSRRLGRTALGFVLAGYIAYVIVIVIAIAHGGDYAVGGFDWLIPSCLYSVFGRWICLQHFRRHAAAISDRGGLGRIHIVRARVGSIYLRDDGEGLIKV